MVSVLTVCVLRLPQEHTGLFAKQHRRVDARNDCRTVKQESLKLVDIVDALAPSRSVLAVNRVDAQTTRSITQDQRILR